jgi:hypothetical protein
VAPVVLELGFMAIYKVPPGNMVLVVLQMALVLTVWGLVVMSAASITRSMGGFAVLCGCTIVGIAVTLAVAVAVIEWRAAANSGELVIAATPQAAGARVGLPPDVPDPTFWVVFASLSVLAALGLIAVQYAWRSRPRAVSAGAAGLAMACALASIWPVPLLRPRLNVPDWAQSHEALRLSLDPSSVRFEGDNPLAARERTWRLAQGQMSIGGLAPGWRASVRHAGASLRLASGATVEGRATGHSSNIPLDLTGEPQNRAGLRDVLSVDRVGGFGQYYPERAFVMSIREADFKASDGATGAYTGRFIVDLSHDEVAAVLPLRQGASYQHGADRFVVRLARAGDDGITLQIRRSMAKTMFDRRPPTSYAYYLRNRGRREAFVTFLGSRRPHVFLPFIGFGFSGYGTEGTSRSSGFGAWEEGITRYPLHGRPFEEELALDDAWINEAELVIVRTTREGSVLRTVEVPGLRVEGGRK